MPDDRDYKVTDKRGVRDGDEPVAETPAPPPAPTPVPAPEALPEIDFATFILSMASSALAHLHGLDEKGEQTLPPNLTLARQSIDILSLLQGKTKGNLTGEEERLLDHVLYDLRLQFVTVAGKQ